MSDTSDPIDAACAREQEWLSDQIANHALKQRFSGDIEGQVCRGCDFVTKSNYGRACEAWQDCHSDVISKARAHKRNFGG